MFEVAVSPVVRLADELAPAGRSAQLLAQAMALPPGPQAIFLLAKIDPDALDDVDRVRLLQTWERSARWVAAQQATAVVAVAGRRAADRDDFAREHVRVALLGCGGSPRAQVDVARALAGPLAPAHDALAAGELSYDHAKVLAQETGPLDPDTARDVATDVVPAGAHCTPAEFRRKVRRAVIKADPVRAELAAQRATEQRQVTRRVEPDAQASLTVTGPAVEVQTIWTALDLHAAHTGSDDRRTLDQRRFDALVDICRQAMASVGAPAGRRGLRPSVYLFADAPTWAGLTDAPVELDGYGPIPAGVARAHFTDSTWRAVVTETITGKVEAVSDRAYTPSARTNRHLHVQDRRCGFPGCGAAVWFCDADHNLPHDRGGCTDVENCGLFCRRHHRLKTFTRWSWQRLPDGTLEWTDPQGHRWPREPIRYLLPVPDLPALAADAPFGPGLGIGEGGPVTARPGSSRAGPHGDNGDELPPF